MPPSIETAMNAMTKVNDIGFVDFTSDLVRNVYGVIVQSSIEQMRGYADLIKDVSVSLADYQKRVGLGNGPDPTVSGNENLLRNCERYAEEVFSLEMSGTGNNKKYKLTASSNPDLVAATNAIWENLEGIDADPSNATDETIKLVFPPPASANDLFTELTPAASKNLDKIIASKLRQNASDEYNILVTILKLGLQKIVVEKGLIATKLTFKVSATETSNMTSTKVDSQSKGFAISGGVTGRFKKVGGSISGGYSNNKLSVSVVNEQSSAVTNLNVDIVGEVKIEFRTDSFPSYEIPAATT